MSSEEAKQVLAHQNEILSKLHAHLRMVGRFPHEGQGEVIRAFFNDKKKIIMGQCGRSFGKSETVLYIAWRYALLNPGKEIYIICPELKQAKKLYWLPKRLQNYGPQEFIAEHRESELRTVFTNGSYIILDGCENYEAMRGIKPHLVFYDEFQHHSQYFDEEVMQPNLSSGKVSLLVFGTPPKIDCHYVHFRQNLLDNIQRGNSKYMYIELHSAKNPTLDKVWLAEKKADLIRRDKYNIWLREYEGKMVFDTESAIFPFFNEKKHVYEHNYLMKLIHRDRHKLRWYDLYDPGTSTVFAGLFIAHNPYTGQLFLLDEIYAQERKECTTQAVYRKSIDIRKDLYDYEDEWTGYYDEAAAWFANEVNEQFGRNLIATHKQKVHATNEEARAGESILNTIMMSENAFFVSDRCVKFLWEILQYMFGENGKYPKKNDHLMDLLFYYVTETNYTIIEEVDRGDDYSEGISKKAQTISQAIHAQKTQSDLSYGYGEDYFDEDPGDGIWN